MRPGQLQLLQQLAPLGQRQADRRGPRQLEYVEDQVGHRRGRRQRRRALGRADVHPRGEGPEVGRAVRPQHDDLPVEHRPHRADRVGQAGQLRVRHGHVGARTAGQPHAVRRDGRQHPDAVPLHLVRPRAVVGGQLARHREHRLQAQRYSPVCPSSRRSEATACRSRSRSRM